MPACRMSETKYISGHVTSTAGGGVGRGQRVAFEAIEAMTVCTDHNTDVHMHVYICVLAKVGRTS